ncbi:MAG: S-layer homology domain-containing protein, partial [Acidimicrobiia bacterium]
MAEEIRRAVVLAVLMGSLLPTPVRAETALAEGFETTEWNEGMVDVRASDLDHTRLVRGFIGSGLEVTIPEGWRRGIGPFAPLPEPAPDEAWFRYMLRLDDWEATYSGKLPGPAGLYSYTARGCFPSQPGSPGWSARMMYAATGTAGAGPGEVRLGYYVYHLDQAGTCGDTLLWGPGVIGQGRWYCVEGQVRVNTPGHPDGLLAGWVDGEPELLQDGLAFRRADEVEVAVKEMWLNVYFGGSFATPNDLRLTIDQLVVSIEGRVGCPDPFLDDDDSQHEADINELHARDLLFGCDDRQVCPEAALTRAELAALLVRALQLPPVGGDTFSDDDGHWAEDVLNRLAEAGILRGCALGRACPDEPVSRAQFAAMATRALELPASEENQFSDDDGHWAESAINAIAAAGITKGCGDGSFCPDSSVTREQAATLV